LISCYSLFTYIFKNATLIKTSMGKNLQLIPTPQTDINSVLRIMDVASAARKQREQVSSQLNIEDSKADLRKRILEAAKVTGEGLRDDDIDKAIEAYLSGLYQFTEPQRGLATSLAHAYIDRVRIGKVYGIPTVIIAGALVTGNVAVHEFKAVKIRGEERAVERKIEWGYNERAGLEEQVRLISNSPILASMDETEKRDVEFGLGEVSARLKEQNEFFVQFCSDGTSSDNVTPNNYHEAGQRFKIVEQILSQEKDFLKYTNERLQTQSNIIATQKSLDLLIADVRRINPPEAFAQRAESYYQSGITSLKVENLSEANRNREALEEVIKDSKDFSILPGLINQVYTSVIDVAKEPQAIQEANKTKQEADSYIRTASVSELRRAVEQLRALNGALQQEYKITIISRPGELTGIDRIYEEKGGKATSGLYIFVEAIDSQTGRAIPMNIKNEEDGRTYQVTKWGERVEENIFESVVKDKKDGRVDNNILGLKEKGYTTPRITFDVNGRSVQRTGQITSW